jgi:protein SCO1
MTMRPRLAAWRSAAVVLAAVATLGVSLLGTLLGSSRAEANRWGRDYIPNVPVVTQDGRTLRFYEDVVQGRRLVISFIFTSCREMCPLITARLTQVYDSLGDAAGRDVQFVSISVDPTNDTPAKMKEHADAFRVGPGWLFLTGTLADITAIRYKLGDRSTNILEHRQDIWLVNDANGDWQRDSAFNDISQISHNIRAMAPGGARGEAAGKITQPPKSATGPAPIQPGQMLFAKACAACHTIGQGDKVGPDLAGMSKRHEKSWLTGFIQTPQRYHRNKDAAALALAEKYKGVRMPNLGLREHDVADVIAFIDARSFAAENPAPAGHDHSGHAAPSDQSSPNGQAAAVPPQRAKAGSAKAGNTKAGSVKTQQHH